MVVQALVNIKNSLNGTIGIPSKWLASCVCQTSKSNQILLRQMTRQMQTPNNIPNFSATIFVFGPNLSINIFAEAWLFSVVAKRIPVEATIRISTSTISTLPGKGVLRCLPRTLIEIRIMVPNNAQAPKKRMTAINPRR